MGLNIEEIAQKQDRLLANIAEQNRKAYEMFYSPTPSDVTLPQYDEDGQMVNVSIPNRAKIKKQMWDDVAGALGQFDRIFYVDETNGLDTNLGLIDSPLKTIKKAIDSTPVGGKVEIILLGDCLWNNDVYANNKVIEIHLKGYSLSIASRAYSDSDDRMVLYALIGSNNLVYVSGDSLDGSRVILPEIGDGTIVSDVTSSWIKTSGGYDAKCNALHISYGVDIVDSGDFYLMTVGYGSVGSFTFSNSTFTESPAKQRAITDLVSGVVTDVNCVPRNLQSNLIF